MEMKRTKSDLGNNREEKNKTHEEKIRVALREAWVEILMFI